MYFLNHNSENVKREISQTNMKRFLAKYIKKDSLEIVRHQGRQKHTIMTQRCSAQNMRSGADT